VLDSPPLDPSKVAPSSQLAATALLNEVLPSALLATTISDENLLVYSGQVAGHLARIMVDSGSSLNIISQQFVTRHRLPVKPHAQPRTVALADGTPHILNQVITISLRFGEWKTRLQALVFPSTHFDLILGGTFLTDHNPSISWKDRSITLTTVDGPFEVSPKNFPFHRASSNLDWFAAQNLLSLSQASTLLDDPENQPFLLFVSPTTETPGVVPKAPWPSLQKIIADYAVLFTTEVPPFPPERKTSHHINTGMEPPSAKRPMLVK
jgi:hypothetical protein